MDGRLRSRRVPVVVLLLLCAAPRGADAQQFVCWPIAPGDTASGLARRLAGDAAAAYTHAFQIRDPARQMFVPKSHYRRLSTDWQACVALGQLKTAPVAFAPVVASGLPAMPPSRPMVTSASLAVSPGRAAPALSVDFVFIARIAAVLLTMLIIVAVGDSLLPRPIPAIMQRAGEEFVSAFAGPLVDSSSSLPPIHARLRFVRRKDQLEISIAPGAGRRYPNLVDHKRNVEYDVNRVMRVLGSHFVVSDRLRAAGKWVVVPIRLTDVKQTGAK
jgi:hypothetical protein